MKVKNFYQCNFCSQSKTCFVFDEFSMIFAICRPCYDKLAMTLPFFEVEDATCNFCSTTTSVKNITGFEDWTFFSEQFICQSCMIKINNAVAISSEKF